MQPKGGGGRRLFDPAVRIGIAAFIVVAGFAVLFIRLGYIQLGHFSGRLTDASRRVWSNMYVHPQRGRILDREGRVLAASVETRSLYAHPARVRDKNRLAILLTRLNLLSLEESLTRLSHPSPFVWLSRGIEPDRWKQIKHELDKIEGVGVLLEWRRRYPLESVGANLIGFVGADGHGLDGVEYMMDRDLAGDIGSLKVEIGDHGMPVIRDSEGRANPVFRGNDVVLAIDAYVQEAADHVLEETVSRYEAKSGSVVVTDPRSGEILAMSSYPTFDPNRFSEFPHGQFRNQAVNDIFEPGSTFKIVTISAIVSERSTADIENVVCRGSVAIPRARPIRCYASHGPISFRGSVEASCNVGIIRAALPLHPESLFRMMQNFGFGIQTGVGLPGEEKGILRKPYRWSGSSQAAMSIGHEVAVTNLQMAMAMCAVAGGGELLKPQILARKNVPPQVVRRVIPASVAASVRSLLVSAVEGDLATGKKAKVADVRVGGKTGTALIPDPKSGGYDPDRVVSSFIGFLPADAPRMVISVVIHEPNPHIAHFGGDVAAPAFSRIAGLAVKLVK